MVAILALPFAGGCAAVDDGLPDVELDDSSANPNEGEENEGEELGQVSQALSSNSPRRERMVKVARSQLGVNERDDPEKIAEYTKGQSRTRDVRWCSEFASWCLSKAGGGAMGYKTSWESIWRWAKQNGRTKTRPAPGDLAIWEGHTAIVESATSKSFVTIGGNESDAVRRATRSFTKSSLLGFVDPY